MSQDDPRTATHEDSGEGHPTGADSPYEDPHAATTPPDNDPPVTGGDPPPRGGGDQD